MVVWFYFWAGESKFFFLIRMKAKNVGPKHLSEIYKGVKHP